MTIFLPRYFAGFLAHSDAGGRSLQDGDGDRFGNLMQPLPATTNAPAKRAIVFARARTADDPSFERAYVDGQLGYCQAVAEALGATITHEYVDDGLPAVPLLAPSPKILSSRSRNGSPKKLRAHGASSQPHR
jgi:hypothetical protein